MTHRTADPAEDSKFEDLSVLPPDGPRQNRFMPSQVIELCHEVADGLNAARRLTEIDAGVSGDLHPFEAQLLHEDVCRGAQAAALVFEAHLPLVSFELHRMQAGSHPIWGQARTERLAGAGRSGLVCSVARYGYGTAPFDSYAGYWIRRLIVGEAVAEHVRAHYDRAQIDFLIQELFSAKEGLREAWGREPSHSELAVALQVVPETITALRWFCDARTPRWDPFAQTPPPLGLEPLHIYMT